MHGVRILFFIPCFFHCSFTSISNVLEWMSTYMSACVCIYMCKQSMHVSVYMRIMTSIKGKYSFIMEWNTLSFEMAQLYLISKWPWINLSTLDLLISNLWLYFAFSFLPVRNGNSNNRPKHINHGHVSAFFAPSPISSQQSLLIPIKSLIQRKNLKSLYIHYTHIYAAFG